jgi:hypothetical protein
MSIVCPPVPEIFIEASDPQLQSRVDPPEAQIRIHRIELVNRVQVRKVEAVSQRKSSNVWI